jgi:hypothetical protein
MTSQKHSSAVTLVLPPSSITSVPAVASPEKIESFLQSVPDILWADTVLSLSSRPGPAVGAGLSIPSLCREELQSVQRELEVLSEQYSQKCLENAHLAQALEAERQALRQCQRENQELNAHNQVRPKS